MQIHKLMIIESLDYLSSSWRYKYWEFDKSSLYNNRILRKHIQSHKSILLYDQTKKSLVMCSQNSAKS